MPLPTTSWLSGPASPGSEPSTRPDRAGGDPSGPSGPSGWARRWRRGRRGFRRALLRRRRLLAALLVGAAVAAGVRAVAAPAPPTTSLLVASHDLPAGTVVGPDDVRPADFAPGSEPTGVVTDPVGVTLAGAVRAGETVTDARVVGPGPALGLDGAVATPVRFPDAAMAGLLSVGDRVDLIATDPADGTAATVAYDVGVLALPGSTGDDAASGSSSASGSSLPGRLVVLALDALDVGEVSAAASTKFVTFTWVDDR